jgi:hypothetical protein
VVQVVQETQELLETWVLLALMELDILMVEQVPMEIQELLAT